MSSLLNRLYSLLSEDGSTGLELRMGNGIPVRNFQILLEMINTFQVEWANSESVPKDITCALIEAVPTFWTSVPLYKGTERENILARLEELQVALTSCYYTHQQVADIDDILYEEGNGIIICINRGKGIDEPQLQRLLTFIRGCNAAWKNEIVIPKGIAGRLIELVIFLSKIELEMGAIEETYSIDITNAAYSIEHELSLLCECNS